MSGRVRHRFPAWCAALLLALAACPPGVAAGAQSACSAPTVVDLQEANRAFEKAHETGDVAGLDALLAEDFALYHSGGLKSEVETRAGFLKRMAGMPAGLFLSRELKDAESRIYGSVGLVSGSIVTRSRSQWTRGRLKESKYHYLRVFNSDGCRWRIAMWHSGWSAGDRRDVQFIDSYLATYPPDAGPGGKESPALLGARTYEEACRSCHHGPGAFGAPGLDNVAFWRGRASSVDRLYLNSLNGLVSSGAVMPAKGGRPDLSDEAVRAAVDFMLAESRSPARTGNR